MSAPRVATAAEYQVFLRTGKWPASALSDPANAEQKTAKRHKYGVGPRHLRQLDGYTFDSIAERKRYEVLRAMEKAGEIIDLRVHPCWPLVVSGVPVGEYQADFAYYDLSDRPGRTGLHVEDVKGVRTRVYAMKKALMLALHNIEIQEVEP